MIVVDTNIIGYLFLASPRSTEAEQAFLKDPQWAAPILWRSELRNVLGLYIRKQVLSPLFWFLFSRFRGLLGNSTFY